MRTFLKHVFSPQLCVPLVYAEISFWRRTVFQKLNLSLVLMTLVLAVSAHAQESKSKLDDLTKSEFKNENLEQIKSKSENSENYVKPTTQDLKLLPEVPTFYFPYQESLSLRIGGAVDIKELSEDNGDKDIPYSIGFEYMFKSESHRHWAVGIDLLSSPQFYLHLGKKIFFNYTEELRPYYKLALAMRFDEGDHIETPFDWKSYAAIAGIGMEDWLKSSRSVRVDLELFFGREDLLALFSVGWSFAF